jgi:hypothetical protein
VLATVCDLISSIIPTFKHGAKRHHYIDTYAEVDSILTYFITPSLERGTIAKITCDTGIPHPTLLDWRSVQIAKRQPMYRGSMSSRLGRPLST